MSADTKKPSLWGGRFEGGLDPRFAQFNRSFPFDRELFRADCLGTLAQVEGLKHAGILSAIEADRLQSALQDLIARAEKDPSFLDDENVEDVHTFLEAKLTEACGDLGKKVHTGRSRNDQVATAFRIWVREACDRLEAALTDLQKALLELGEKGKDAILPGYTHLQRAQPILFRHYCLSYIEMLERDLERVKRARVSADVLPLGSGALAGSGFAVDRKKMAEVAGFSNVSRNSLDAVSDRDFALEALFAASVGMMHLSRMCEDFIVYASQEFAFLSFSDSVSTGSSLMPQKKNPDAFELIRGKTGRVYGDLVGLLTVMKGLPLAYNKDLQEDKEGVFDALRTFEDSLVVAAISVRGTTPNSERMLHAAAHGYLDATELADYLVEKNVPFREAHEIVGKLVKKGIASKKELRELSLQELQSECGKIEASVFERLTPQRCVDSRKASGGTSEASVDVEWKKWLEKISN